MSFIKQVGSETEFTAASALAGLAASEPREEEEEEEYDCERKEGEDFHIPQRFTKSGRKRAVPFTIKLMKVLSDKNNADIITWMPSGKSFNILKPKAFVADILPEHFKTAKYSSFTRKLHRWGFMRHYRGEEAGAFYHKDFQRGRLDLVEQMTCHKGDPPKSTPAFFAVAVSEKKAAKPLAVAQPVVPSERPQPQLSAAALMPRPVLKVPAAALPSQAVRTPVMATPTLPLNMPSLPPSMALPKRPTAATVSAQSSATSATERLNAAIEHEVNRRLQERINAVALQRRAFAVSTLRQQQLALTAPPSSSLTAFWLQKQQQAGLFKSAVSLPFGLSNPLGFRALAPEGPALPSAPTDRNIQGARTA